MKKSKAIIKKSALYFLLSVLAAVFVFPVLTVFANSFKERFSISGEPFALPDKITFAGIENYINGIKDTEFLSAFFYSVFITVFSVSVIVFLHL